MGFEGRRASQKLLFAMTVEGIQSENCGPACAKRPSLVKRNGP